MRNPQFNMRGILFHDIPVSASPASKKRRAFDMAHILQQKKKKHQDPLDQVTVETDNDSESGDNRYDDFGVGSPRRDSLINSILEETRNFGVNVNVSNTDTITNSSDHTSISIVE